MSDTVVTLQPHMLINDGVYQSWHLPRYDHDQAVAACEAMREGITLHEFCKTQRETNPKFPTSADMRGWYVMNGGGEFTIMYALARRALADHWAEEILLIGDDGRNDYMDRLRRNGTIAREVDHESVHRSKLRCDNRRWLLSKLHPDMYAERIQHQTLGRDGQPVDPPSAINPIDLSIELNGWKPKE
jgi:hypothetical protein